MLHTKLYVYVAKQIRTMEKMFILDYFRHIDGLFSRINGCHSVYFKRRFLIEISLSKSSLDCTLINRLSLQNAALTSGTHLLSSVIVFPKQLSSFTCSTLLSLVLLLYYLLCVVITSPYVTSMYSIFNISVTTYKILFISYFKKSITPYPM